MASGSGKEIGLEKNESRAGVGLVRDFFLCRCMSDASLPNCMFSFGLSEDDRTRLCEASACLIISLRESGGFDFVVFIFFF